MGQVAYKLELPTTSKLHPVFHVSQLRRAVGDTPVCSTIPDQLSAEMELLVQPEELLDVRTVQEGHLTKFQVLIKWEGLPTFEATWEDVEMIKERFPTFHLKDKVNLWGGGNVMKLPRAPVRITYARRGKDKKGNAQKNAHGGMYSDVGESTNAEVAIGQEYPDVGRNAELA